MEKNHSKEWEILRFQEKKHKREKAVLISIIMVLLIINLVLANIVWSSRHNNETASANSPEIQTAAVAKKFGADTSDFYGHMAKAFLEDKDAGPDKLKNYFEEVVDVEEED